MYTTAALRVCCGTAARYDESAIDRLSEKIEICDSGCWAWLAGCGWGGYGRFGYWRRGWQAHRAVWTLLVGPIPDGLHLDHHCRNRRCVNPDHLEPVTQAENSRRVGPRLGRVPAKYKLPPRVRVPLWRRRLRCRRGHEFTAENTYDNGRHRTCRRCRRDRAKARELERRLTQPLPVPTETIIMRIARHLADRPDRIDRTRTIAVSLGATTQAVSTTLHRAAATGQVRKIRRGLWALPVTVTDE